MDSLTTLAVAVVVPCLGIAATWGALQTKIRHLDEAIGLLRDSVKELRVEVRELRDKITDWQIDTASHHMPPVRGGSE